jgi:rfaE bifunctional protein nucleotidyltransferase chain/domain
MDISEKIMTSEKLGAWRAGIPWETGGLAVLTGAFDILQPGNLTAVRRAAACAGHVCVVVDGGETVSRESGARPRRSLAERAETVSHLRHVSAVCAVKAGEEAARYFEPLRPYTHVVCSERGMDALSKEADRLAGKRELLPELPGCSTAEIVAAIREGKTPIKLPDAFMSCLSVLPRPSKASRRGKPSRSVAEPATLQCNPTASHGGPRAPGPSDRQEAGKGRRIVVSVNGCFDVLHAGHLRFLAQARGMGDELIVLVNDDKSVGDYKGAKRPSSPAPASFVAARPIFPLEFRIEALLTLESVSNVCPFGGDNPLKVLDLLRPDIHVKGGSYEPERVERERRLLESWGGSLRFCPMVENYSTSGWLDMVTGG